MVNFLKGILAGIGGIAPGLSGTVLLILMGLYRPVLDALGSLFTDFKGKIRFLLPIVTGMLVGVLAFSRFYTPAYCVIFGIFLTMIPKILGTQPDFGWNGETVISLALAVIGFFVSLLLGRLEK